MKVGIRELRDSLSKHITEVRTGRTITITDHGKPVARLVPVGTPSRLEQLIAEGRVTPAARRKRTTKEPVVIDVTVSDLITEQRR